ncbi:MAG: flavodoxin domain-containing protein [Bacteroidota bacterium]
MLTAEKHTIIKSLIDSSTKEELIWINGYLSGIINDTSKNKIIHDNDAIPSLKKLTIVFGSETGNSKKLATEFATKAKKKHIQTKLVSLDQYRLNDLVKEELFVTVISTQGEGEPPIAAQKFYDHIHQNGFKLQNLQYAVLALGDSSYPLFCKAGVDVDEQLLKLGGKRLVAIQKCDVDYEAEADAWFDLLLNGLSTSVSTTVHLENKTEVVVKKSTGKTIYQGKVLTHLNLNDRGSNKETWHIEIAAESLVYEAGDSIGIVPKNNESVVASIIQIAKADPLKLVNYKSESVTIYNLLKHKLNISNLNEKLVKRYADIIKQEIPVTKIDLLALLKIYPLQEEAQFIEVLQSLNPQSPRLYTVSSSPLATEGEVHITVARDVFLVEEEMKYGVCSDYLSSVTENETIEFFVQKNKRFKLPSEDKDIIMIGPGTGIAAFRGFLYEREAIAATGRSWLFFGEQHFASDFLYQTEIQNWEATGTLTKINVAFSRDQHQKIYVQDRMLSYGSELYQWIQNGAYIYVCGKKDPMSLDVEKTLIQIIQQYGHKSMAEANQFVEELKDTHRYHKDVY